MSGPELRRRIDALRAYAKQLAGGIQSVEADWGNAYAQWQQTKAPSDVVACTQCEERVHALKKQREQVLAKILAYERTITKKTGLAFTKGATK